MYKNTHTHTHTYSEHMRNVNLSSNNTSVNLFSLTPASVTQFSAAAALTGDVHHHHVCIQYERFIIS